MIKKISSLIIFGFLFLLDCTQEESDIPLAVTAISPSNGKKNVTVEIIGTGFSSEASLNAVTFNGKTAVITSATSTKLVVQVPSKAGTGEVVVSTQNETVTGPVFEYQTTVTVTTYAGSDLGYEDGTGGSAKFKSPQGLSIDNAGNLYVADREDNRIRKISPNAEVSTVAGSGIAGHLDGNASQAQFYVPSDVAVDNNGNIYVADKIYNFIRKITPGGIVSTFAGSGLNGYKDGQGTMADLNNPTSIIIDLAGNLFVMDEQNNAIRKVTTGGLVTTFSGHNYVGDPRFMDGSAEEARFNIPTGIAIDKSGNIFVADRENNRIRRVATDGSVSTIAGDGNFGNLDGASASAKFASPFGVAADGNGNIYVADERNHSIRIISPIGIVTTLAGVGVAGDVDGDGSIAKFNYPRDIVIDKSGNLFVTDSFNHKIKKIILE